MIRWNATLVEDTINYIKSDCKTTNFKEKITVHMNTTKPTYDGYGYGLAKWYENAKKLADESAKAYCMKNGTKCRG